VVLGLLIGTLLCYTNLYFGLQTGWISMSVQLSSAVSLSLTRRHRMSLQSALIGFFLSRAIGSLVTPQENVVIQTTAVATGTMALAAGFVGIIPALGLLNVVQDGIPPIRLSWTAALAWSFAVAYYGFVLLPRLCLCISNRRHAYRILMSPPIRKRVVSALTDPPL
jgi:uncharacterized oligopeptide transporter (OPT) family protein